MARTVGARNAGVQLAVKVLAGNTQLFEALKFSNVSREFIARKQPHLVISDFSKSPSARRGVKDWGNHVVTSHA